MNDLRLNGTLGWETIKSNNSFLIACEKINTFSDKLLLLATDSFFMNQKCSFLKKNFVGTKKKLLRKLPEPWKIKFEKINTKSH
jgi:hypothetical protein